MTELVPLPRAGGHHHRRPDPEPEPPWARALFAELAAVRSTLSRILTRQNRHMEMTMTTQDTINRIATGLGEIDTQISTLAGQGVDTSGLEAAFAKLQGDVHTITGGQAGQPPTDPASDPGFTSDQGGTSTGDVPGFSG